ncbi:MAG: zinc-ribbon domain containing protein [Desulfotomaculaceae bacterium]|nr:zinc-ribbon domain containing protein [Desulfotomaculaceae bacterium]
MFTSKVLQCKDCGQEFEFTAGEQEFFAEKGFTNEPSRCPSCRALRKNNREYDQNRWSGNRQNRQMYEVTCDGCGQIARVPFQPDGSRPVYCSDCFRNNRRYAQ